MTDHPRQIYLLNPKVLSQETIAVAFAKTSRSPESFKEIASELNDARSAEFNEKWVVGYGHASVAEHAVLHIAIENVSRLAVEPIQSARLASFTEKSTRYQKWSSDAYHVPTELDELPDLREIYLKTCKILFETYQQILEPCKEVAARNCPRQDAESDGAYERRLRSSYVDSCRFLLPAASLANLGMTINARSLEHLLSKLLSHPLQEVRRIGEEIKLTAQDELPTLVKYANRNPYLVDTPLKVTKHTQTINSQIEDLDWCRLINYPEDGEDAILASLLYRYGNSSYADDLAAVKAMSLQQKKQIYDDALSGMDRFDWPLREMEHIHYSFDVSMDQGAYYEVKRHRMMTQSPQQLTCELGYAVPQLVEQAGCTDTYCRAMDQVYHSFQVIHDHLPEVASYLVPNGYLRRVLLTMNYREAFSFIQLRSAPNAHFSVRLIAKKMAEELCKVHPLLGSHLRANQKIPWQTEADLVGKIIRPGQP